MNSFHARANIIEGVVKGPAPGPRYPFFFFSSSPLLSSTVTGYASVFDFSLAKGLIRSTFAAALTETSPCIFHPLDAREARVNCYLSTSRIRSFARCLRACLPSRVEKSRRTLIPSRKKLPTSPGRGKTAKQFVTNANGTPPGSGETKICETKLGSNAIVQKWWAEYRDETRDICTVFRIA